jgi:transposase
MGQYFEDDPERAERKAEGAALVVAGTSYRAASREVGLPVATLQRAVDRLKQGVASNEDLRRADMAQMAQVYELAQRTGKALLDRLDAHPETLESRDLIKAQDSAVRAISNYRQWHKPDTTADSTASSRILDRLEAALTSGAELSLTITPPKPDHRAIDVEPTTE